MKRFSFALLASAVSFIIVGAVAAAPPLQIEASGDVTTEGDSATIVNDAGEYGAVYIKAHALNNKRVGDVNASFVSTGEVAGGAPRLNLPIDADGDKDWDYWAVLDAANCGGTSGNPTLVSTENASCVLYFLGPAPAASYPNWDAFVAANPDARIASKGASSTPFIIADVEGEYAVEAIDLQ